MDEIAGHLRITETASDCPEGTAPVLLLHRAGGSARAWQPVVDALGDSRRSVLVDLPAHGEATGPALESIEAMAEQVAEALAARSEPEVVAVGHSMGGAVALALALHHPKRVRALLLVCSGARLRVSKMVLEAVRTQFEHLPKLVGPMIFSADTPPERREALAAELFDAPAEVVVTDLEACDAFDAEPELAELKVPITLLAGSEDHLTPPRLSRRLSDRAPNAELHVLKGQGHMLPLERPETVAEAALELSQRTVAADV